MNNTKILKYINELKKEETINGINTIKGDIKNNLTEDNKLNNNINKLYNNNNMVKKKKPVVKVVKIQNPITNKLISIKSLSKNLRTNKYNQKEIQQIQNKLKNDGLGYNTNTGRISKSDNRKLKKQIKIDIKKKGAVDKLGNWFKEQQVRINKKIKKNSVKISYSIDTLLDDSLVYEAVKMNNFKGEYRIICIGNDTGDEYLDINTNITGKLSKWWRDNYNKFQFSSEAMLWNWDIKDNNSTIYDKLGNKIILEGETKTFYYTKLTKIAPKNIIQAFLDGVNHCFFTPILEWAKNSYETTKSKSSKTNYLTIINKIQGSQELKENKYYFSKKTLPYLTKYKNGIPENEIQKVIDDLKISVEITQPFCKKPLLEITSQTKARKKFKFINTRLNHIEKNEYKYTLDTIHQNDMKDAIIIERDEINKIYKNLYDNKEDFIYKKDIYGICCIKTFKNIYTIDNNFRETINEFEKETNLYDCSIDAKKYPELTNFIIRGTHFNGTIDFIKDIPNNKQKLVDDDNIKHIDMEKAYTQFQETDYYNGFCGKITDFRKVDNFKQKGLYFITNMDLSKSNDKFKTLNEKLGWFFTDNIYTDVELKLLTDYGGKFEVLYGAYGLRLDFEFNEDMTNKKETISICNGEEKKVPYYSKYTGMISMINDQQSFFISQKKGLGDYLSIIQKNNDEDEVNIYHDEVLNEASIRFKKKHINHKRHIASQILAYQRIIMLEQLMKMDINKIIRICVDGIYFEKHSFEIGKTFNYKTKKTFNNAECENYLSGIFFDDQDNTTTCDICEYKPIAEKREFYTKELFIGGGGCGKTHFNLTDKGLINVCFVAPSWKLASKKKEEFDYISSSVLYRFLHEPYKMEYKNRYNNLIIDEASMITEYDKQQLFKSCNCRLIFCGDLGFQLPPVITNADILRCKKDKIDLKLLDEMNSSGFENIVEMKTNHRSGDCNELMKIIKYLRMVIKKNENISFNHIINQIKHKLNYINLEKLKVNYNKTDLIICSENTIKDSYTKMFENIIKYRVMNNSRDYKKGSIIYEDIKNIEKQIQHGYTIHSIQGETATTNLYIDLEKNKSIKMLYTAISRAKNIEQIHIIKKN